MSSLNDEINDSMTLLVGAMSIMNSEIQRELAIDHRIQTRRSTALTTLAAIYSPLSLATGVFGMNIWEINQGSPRWWVAFALGLDLLVISIPFLAGVYIDRPSMEGPGEMMALQRVLVGLRADMGRWQQIVGERRRGSITSASECAFKLFWCGCNADSVCWCGRFSSKYMYVFVEKRVKARRECACL